jgi:hypothetical protein
MKILYCSLFPKEDNCEVDLFNKYFQTAEENEINDLFTYRIFSAHQELVDQINTMYPSDNNINDFSNKVVAYRNGFVYDDSMDERRAHEISYGKKSVFKFACNHSDLYDYFFYNDSDLEVRPLDVYWLCKSLEKVSNTVVSLPYALRDMKVVPPNVFGSHIIPSSILKDNEDLADVIYSAYEAKNGKIKRKGAPDTNLHDNLKSRGYTIQKATSIVTKHHFKLGEGYVEYYKGKINIVGDWVH